MTVEIVRADYRDRSHAHAINELMNHYASDPFGGGKPLPDSICSRIAEELSKRDFAFTLLCFVDGEAVGLVNCFETFSTFACKPVINIHDIVVKKSVRGKGLSHALLEAVENIARERGCCKLTLEVLSNNDVAKASYENFGFSDYQLNPEHGHALFWQKLL